MSIDEARRQVRPFKIDHPFTIVIAQTNHPAIFHCHRRLINLAAQDVHEICVPEEEFGGLLSASDAQFLLKIAHLKVCYGILLRTKPK